MDGDEEAFLPSSEIVEQYDLEDAVRETTSTSSSSASDHEMDADIQTAEGQDIPVHEGREPVALFTGHRPSEAYAVAILKPPPRAESSKIVVSGGEDNKALVWLISTDGIQVLQELEFSESVCSIIASGSTCCISTVDGIIHLYSYSASSGLSHVADCEGTGEPFWMDFSRQTEDFAVAGEEGTVWVYSPTGRVISVCHGLARPSTAGLFFSHDRVIAGDSSGSLYCFNAGTGKAVWKVSGLQAEVLTMALADDKRSLLVGTGAGELVLVNAATGHILHRVSAFPNQGAEAVAYSGAVPGGIWIAGGADSRLLIYSFDLATLRSELAFSDAVGQEEESLSGVAFIRPVCNDRAAIALMDGKLILVDIKTGEPVATLQSPVSPVLDIAHDRDLLVTASASGLVSVHAL